MAIKYFSNIDLQKNELLQPRIQNATTSVINALTNSVDGQLIYDTTIKQLKIYDANISAWKAVDGGAGTVTAVTGTAPVSVTSGNTPEVSMAAATSSVNGYMTSTYAAKLDGIAPNATANVGTVTSVSWTGGIVSIATDTVTPAFTVAGNSGGIPYFSTATGWATSGVLAANSIVIGGGAGVAPSTTTTGANVLTALGIAVGSPGAFTPNNVSNTFTHTTGQFFRQGATKDGILISGRNGGTSSYSAAIVPPTLGSDIVVTLPSSTGQLALLASPTFTGTINGASLILSGDLTVNGTTTTINTNTLDVKDKNITIGDVATPSDATADGGGITLKGNGDKTFNWVSGTGAWTSSENLDLASGMAYGINGTDVLTNNTLGSGVTASSLTSVGTLTGLTVTGTGTTPISIKTGSSGALTLDTGSTGAINIGTNANNKTITIGSSGNGTVQLPTGKTKVGVTSLVQGGSVDVTLPTSAGTLYATGNTDVALADGGTNASLTAVNGGIVYSGASAMSISEAGTAGQVLQSAGTAAPTWVTRNYVTTIGDNNDTSFPITHGLATKDVIVQLYDNNSGETIMADVTRNLSTEVTILFNTAPTTDQVRVLITKIV
jgi:hypothetical protein